MATARYEVLQHGNTISRHRTADAAIRAARRVVRADGLDDDGAYCGDDGWPLIVDRRDPNAHIDY